MSDFKDNVKVAIRIRPLNDKEQQESGSLCLNVIESKTILLESKPEPKSFTYDNVADEKISQEEVFEIVGKPITASCMRGYNGTIFAYGQTGAGKTFTIQGAGYEEFSSKVKVNYHLRGILPRCFEYLFATISEEIAKKKSEYLVKCSFLEIYQENINDLLDPAPRNLQLREDMKKGVYVEGLIEETVKSAMETYELLNIGAQNRHVSFTSMNKESSRSHSVFTLIIESKNNIEGLFNFKTSRFHLIDLAGSERQKATDCTGERLKEAGMINKSLSALGNVINSLVDISEGKSRHVHYRDSKLTFLLKDSLGGNSKTFIIANVSPAASAFAETLSTLKFAQRAKMIKNAAVVNEDVSGTVNLLKYEIKKLKDELSLQKSLTSEVSTFCSRCNSSLSKNYELISLLENMRDLELLLESNTRLRVSSEKQLQSELLDKEESIKTLKSTLSKVESKANHDKMVLKFRDATIAKLQIGLESAEVENLKKEIISLKEQVENNPLAAQLFVENRRLKAENENLKKELKVDPESWNGRIRDNHNYTEKLCDAIKNIAEEKEKIAEWIRKLDLDNEELSNLVSMVRKESEEKVKILESENIALGKKTHFLMSKKASKDDLFGDDENLLKSAEIIQDFFQDAENSSIVVGYQREIEGLKEKLSRVAEGKVDEDFKVRESEEKYQNLQEQLQFYLDLSESKDNLLKQAQQEIENLNETCDYLKSNVDSLQKSMTSKEEENTENLLTITRLETQLNEMIKSISGSQELFSECSNLNIKLEELQKEREKLIKQAKSLKSEKEKFESLYESSLIQESNEKKNVSMLYDKLASSLNELEQIKESNQELNEKVEILEEEKLKFVENAAGFDELMEKFRMVTEDKDRLVLFIEELEKKEAEMLKENNEMRSKLGEIEVAISKFQEIESENLIMISKIAELTLAVEELDRVKAENDGLLAKVQRSELEIKRLEEYKDKYRKLRSEAKRLEVLVGELSESAEDWKLKVKESEQEKTGIIEKNKVEYEGIVDGMKKRIDELEIELLSKGKIIDENESRMTEMKLSLQSKSAELEGLSHNHTYELSTSNDKLLSLTQKLETLQQTHTRVFEKLSKEKEKRKEMTQQLYNSVESLKSNEQKIDSLNLSIFDLNLKIDSQSKEIEAKNLIIEELESTLASERLKIKNIEKILSDLNNEKKDLQVLVSNNSEVIQSLNAKIQFEEESLKIEKDSKHEISELIIKKSKEIQELNEKLAALAESQQDLKSERDELAELTKVNEESIKDLQKCLESERACIEENIELRIKSEEQVKQYHEEIKTIQVTLSQSQQELVSKQESIETLKESLKDHEVLEETIKSTLTLLNLLPASDPSDLSDLSNHSNSLSQSSKSLSSALKQILSSPDPLKALTCNTPAPATQLLLHDLCKQLSLPQEQVSDLPSKFQTLTSQLEDLQRANHLLSESLTKESKRAEILNKESEILKLKICKSSSETSKEIQSLKDEIFDLQSKLSLSSSMPQKLQNLEQSTTELSSKVFKINEINQEISIENSVLRSENAELAKSKEKIELDLKLCKEEIENLKEENKNKMEILKNTNKNILSTRNEINMWKKCIDDKNLLIQELRDELRKKEEEVVKGPGRRRKESADEEEPEVRHLNQIILIKDKELKELKEKGQEYYAQADEALESQRKEIEIFTKRVTALQGETKRLKEELKLSLKDRESMIEEVKRLKSEEFRSHKEREEARKQILQLRDEKTKLLLELTKDNDFHKPKTLDKIRQENLFLKSQLEKLAQDYSSLQHVPSASTRSHSSSGKPLKSELEKQAEEIRSLTLSLSKLTDFIFSLPNIPMPTSETSIVESAIKALKSLVESPSPEESSKQAKPKFKSSLAQYYALINKRQ